MSNEWVSVVSFLDFDIQNCLRGQVLMPTGQKKDVEVL